MNVEQFKETVGQLMTSGELKLDIKKREDGFKLVVCEYELMCFYNPETLEPTGEQDEFNSVMLTLYTNRDGEIGFIEHPYGAFTRVNAREAAFVISLIGCTIEGLNEDLSDY